MNTPVDPAVSAAPTGAPAAAALQMIDRLIGFPTVSRDSNLGLIEFARDHLAGLGVKPRLVYDRREKKANLFCTLADDPAAVRNDGLILSGHTDTVPVDGQEWDSDPFVASHSFASGAGRIHGRGSADMKGFIAIALAWAPRFLQAQARLPIHLALTYDEETTFLGIRGLVADLQDQGVKPAGCIIGEPTDMRAIVAHKGKRDYCCRLRGREAHSSLTPTGVNAIEYAALLVAHIRRLADRMAREEPKDARFEVPYSTLQTGVIRGGIAVNVVPKDCSFEFEMRNIPATPHDALAQTIINYARNELLPQMRAVAPDADIQFEIGMDLPAFGIAADAPIVQWAQQLARTAHLGAGAVSFATEASMFSKAGIPTVVMGPGSIEQAHKPNEYVSYAQVAACEALFERLCSAGPFPR
ncbi:MAG: acetylornithine deacetylase [Burkholderiales bacterium]|nr:acetylornithine deacetylase [Burkholderiales bacterium]